MAAHRIGLVSLHRLGVALRHAAANLVHPRDMVSPTGIALRFRALVPVQRFGRIARQAATFFVQKPDMDLGDRIALIGERLQQAQGRPVFAALVRGHPEGDAKTQDRALQA